VASRDGAICFPPTHLPPFTIQAADWIGRASLGRPLPWDSVSPMPRLPHIRTTGMAEMRPPCPTSSTVHPQIENQRRSVEENHLGVEENPRLVAEKMMDTGGASSGGARRGISAADVAASGWLQRRSSACSRDEASKMMGRGGASSGGAPLRRPGSSSTRRC
jgi:hypothetical protein